MNHRLRTFPAAAVALAAVCSLTPKVSFAAQPTPPPEEHRNHERHRVMMIRDGEGRLGELRRVGMGRGFLGIEVMQLSAELREHFGASDEAGVLVARVLDDGPAARAGVKVGDVITAINNEEISSEMDVLRTVRPLKQGATADLDIVRDGRTMSLTVAINERERERIDVRDVLRWKSEDGEDHHLPPEAFFISRDGEWAIPRIPRDLGERISKSLEGIDWKEIAEKAGRSSEELEKRIADLEKRLADLSKKLEAAARQ